MIVNFIQKCASAIKNTMLFYQNHSIAISTFSVIVFTAECYFMVTFYTSYFGFDFFIFGGMSDIYQMALHQGVIIKLLLISLSLTAIPISLYSFLTTTVKNEVTTDDKLYKSREILPIIIITFVFFGFLSSPMLLSFSSKIDAEEVKNGFSARYNIETNNDSIQCNSIIGATSSYVFIWDHKSMITSVLPKSEIKALSLVVPPPPSNRSPSPGRDYKQKVQRQKELQKNWSSTLEDKCHQSVTWIEW